LGKMEKERNLPLEEKKNWDGKRKRNLKNDKKRLKYAANKI
jgi:ribosomal protein S30